MNWEKYIVLSEEDRTFGIEYTIDLISHVTEIQCKLI